MTLARTRSDLDSSARANLIAPWPPLTSLDVILLRNVLIYLAPEAKRGILARTKQRLAPGAKVFIALIDPADVSVQLEAARQRLPGGADRFVFRKVRHGGVSAAEREWHWLHELPRLGFSASAPVYFARSGERTVIATVAAAGRPLSCLLVEAGVEVATGYALAVIVPLVRRLHGKHLVFRDLYWQHWFASALRSTDEPVWIDVERVLRPRLMWQRWVVKDLAGLVSSWPFEPASFASALVRAYRGFDDAVLTARVTEKARRIAARASKFGAKEAPTHP